MIIITQITALDTISVRQPVLRNGKPVESCRFDGDDLSSTIHFGLFENDQIQAVISLFEAKHQRLAGAKHHQIRGMAVLEQHQKKGFGKMLLTNAENYCIQQQTNMIWFNARQTAVGFYKKMGYYVIGPPFEIIDVGLHVVMCKNVDPY